MKDHQEKINLRCKLQNIWPQITVCFFLLIDCIVQHTKHHPCVKDNFSLYVTSTIYRSTQKCLETAAAFQLFIIRFLYFVNLQVSKLKRQSGYWIFHNFVVNDIFQGVKESFLKQKPLFNEYSTVNGAGVNKIVFRLHAGGHCTSEYRKRIDFHAATLRRVFSIVNVS